MSVYGRSRARSGGVSRVNAARDPVRSAGPRRFECSPQRSDAGRSRYKNCKYTHEPARAICTDARDSRREGAEPMFSPLAGAYDRSLSAMR